MANLWARTSPASQATNQQCHTKWTSCHTCQIKKICTSPSKICPPRFTDLAGLLLANPRTLEESGKSLWQWMHINAHQMNNLWQWTCKAMPSHIKWLMHIAPELAVQNVAHDLSSQTSMNQMEGDKKYQCCSEKKSVENSSRNTNQAMTCLSAPHVLLFSTHCQKNNGPPTQPWWLQNETGDRWQMIGDRWGFHILYFTAAKHVTISFQLILLIYFLLQGLQSIDLSQLSQLWK